MLLSGDPIIRCSKCGKRIKLLRDCFDGDTYSIGEFSMGDRVQHDFRCELDCECGNPLRIVIHGYEYPVGAFEYQESEAEGCEILYEPAVEMEYFPEEVISIYKQILQNPQYVYEIEPWEFENFVADVFMKNGFNTEVTQRTRDGGKDIVATFEMSGVLYNTYFECKQQAPDRPVGVDVVRNLYAVMQRDRVDKGVIVTTSHFTRDAIREVQILNGRIKLVDFKELKRLMK